jgi:hypothetical protein
VAEVKADDQDYWTTPVGQYNKVVDAPVTLEKAMENIAAVMGTGEAQEAPSCKHGHMAWREGTKNNKAWGGYFCSVVNHQGGEPKCPTVWYSLLSVASSSHRRHGLNMGYVEIYNIDKDGEWTNLEDVPMITRNYQLSAVQRAYSSS